jgi:PAS domain S-box-containing protein
MSLTGFSQIYIFVFQCALVAAIYLSLFKLRKVFGLTLLVIMLGVSQLLQVFLASSLNYELTSFLTLTSGSKVLFSASIFVILLVYIKENTEQARKIIYGLVVANLLLTVLMFLFSNTYEGSSFESTYNLPKDFFIANTRFLFFGSILLFLDALGLIILYEYFAKHIKTLFFRIFFPVTIVLLADAIIFSSILNYQNPLFYKILVSNIFSKGFASLIYSVLTTVYILYFDKTSYTIKKTKASNYFDIIKQFTFNYKQLLKDKVKIEKNLYYTKNYLQAIFDGTSDAIFIHDAKTGEILDVNQEMCNQFGYTKEEVFNNDMNSLSSGVPPYTKADAQKWLQKVKDEGQQTFEWQAKHKDGHVFWVEVSIKFITIGNKPRFIATARYIDDRKRAEEKLKEQEEDKLKIETILNYTDDDIWALDRHFKLIAFNQAYKNTVLNLGNNELKIGDSIFDKYSKENNKYWKPKYEKVLKGEKLTFEYTNIEDKLSKHYEIKLNPIIIKNAVVGVSAIGRDITERLLTAAKLQESTNFILDTLENMTDAYVSLDNNWYYTYVNKNAGKLFGRKPEDLIGKHIWTEFPEGINQPFYKNYYKAVKTQKSIVIQEYFEPWDRWFENRIIPSKNGLAIFFQDITENKKAIEKIKLQNMQLLEAEEDYRHLFINAPVALWDEDFTEVIKILDGLKKQGVTDLIPYLDSHPDVVKKCTEAIKVVEVNDEVIKLHQAENKEDLFTNIDQSFTPQAFLAFKNELNALYTGKESYETEALLKTFKGEERTVHIKFGVFKNEKGLLDYSKVQVAMVDISEKVVAEEALKQLNKDLENKVAERTLELENKSKILERLNKVFVGRELKMKELKEQIKKLEQNNN